MTVKVADAAGRRKGRNVRMLCASFSAWVRPVSSRYSRTPAGIITQQTRVDSHKRGN